MSQENQRLVTDEPVEFEKLPVEGNQSQAITHKNFNFVRLQNIDFIYVAIYIHDHVVIYTT